jgi:phosphomannomutase
MATLMVSISGVRGIVGASFTPQVICKYVEAFCAQHPGEHVVLGRDSRVSGPWVSQLVEAVLLACGKRVTNIGLVATPTVQLAVLQLHADGGGVVVTSSHNPIEWNGLKFVAPDSLFVSPEVCEAM